MQKSPANGAFRNFLSGSIFAVFTDGVDRAAFEGFHALIDVFLGRRLGEDIRVAAVVLAHEELRGGLAAKVAIDTLGIDVKLTGDAFGMFVVLISHGGLISERGKAGVKNARQLPGIMTISRWPESPCRPAKKAADKRSGVA